MKKIAIALLACCVSMTVFSANKTTTQKSKNTISQVYAMDSFNPTKFSASNIPEFTRRYFSEAEVFLKKDEFETTAEYEKRIAQGFKLKSLDSNKIYAFELDSTGVDYDVDTAQYKIRMGGVGVGDILEHDSYLNRDNYNTLRVGKIYRKTGSYVGSNAYGLKVKIQELEGEDFYIKYSSNLKYEKENIIVPVLTFPVSVEKAKQYSTCSKKLYVFAQLNNSKPDTSSNIVGAVNSPTRSMPFKIYVTGKVIPMDIKGMVLKCSNGQVISTIDESAISLSSENNRTQKSPIQSFRTSELDKQAYISALDTYKKEGAAKALVAMREFIKNYPNSEHVADAHFWLAEFTLSGEPINYAEAKENYEIVFTRFPDSIKAAQALYKLYDITRNVDRNYRLANQYRAKLIKAYPESPESGFVK